MEKVLPAEILVQIYSNLRHSDILTCQYVCHSWHTPAKRQFYDSIEFKTFISVSLFNNCMSRSQLRTLPAPGHFVRKVVFAGSGGNLRGGVRFTLSKNCIRSLANFCPNIEIIECPFLLRSAIHEALLSLSEATGLPRLRRIPLNGPLYSKCALKFCQSLDELYIDAPLGDYGYLRSFTHLSSVDITEGAADDIYTLVNILNICPQLIELQVSLIEDPTKRSDSRPCYLQYVPSLERLRINSLNGRFSHVSIIHEMIMKMKHLKELVFVVADILDVLEDEQQQNALAGLILSTHRLQNTVITVYGQDHNKVSDIALKYVESVFQSSEKGWYTSLMIKNNNLRDNYGVCKSLKYESSSRERTVEILLPDIESEDRVLHEAYVQRFARDVNDLIINYEGTQLNQHGCDFFLETVIEQCQQLQSLTLICGNYSDWECHIRNPNIYCISLIASFLSPTFFYTLSQACPYLKRLSIYKCHVNMTNDMIHYYMPDTSLDVIDFNLDQFKLSNFYETGSTIIKVVLKSRQAVFYYYTNYNHFFMMELSQEEGLAEMNNQESLSVIMEFNDIQKIRTSYFGIPGIEINLITT